MRKKEVEIKFKINDLEEIKNKLKEIGAKDMGRVLEHNEKFDNKSGLIGQRGSLLRLRQDEKARLTLKLYIGRDRFKEMEELEVEVSDFQTVKSILEYLGYRPKWVYEKYRHTFIYKDVEVVIDELPIDENYIEIEGEKDGILATVKALGLNIKDSTTTTYTKIYRNHCQRKKIQPGDMIF